MLVPARSPDTPPRRPRCASNCPLLRAGPRHRRAAPAPPATSASRPGPSCARAARRPCGRRWRRASHSLAARCRCSPTRAVSRALPPTHPPRRIAVPWCCTAARAKAAGHPVTRPCKREVFLLSAAADCEGAASHPPTHPPAQQARRTAATTPTATWTCAAPRWCTTQICPGAPRGQPPLAPGAGFFHWASPLACLCLLSRLICSRAPGCCGCHWRGSSANGGCPTRRMQRDTDAAADVSSSRDVWIAAAHMTSPPRMRVLQDAGGCP